MAQLKQLTFYKLENGWTVKYDLRIDGLANEGRCSKIIYAKDQNEVANIVGLLISEHLK